jgi:phenylalanyl-tRNA synthetase beta chain
MKISVAWLRELVDLPQEIGWQEIARRLTFAGLEVESASHVGAGLSGAIVAEVRGRRPHPKADKLTLVDVFDGQTVTQVVCGAPNVPAPPPGEDGRPGPRVVWARPGARLPSGLVLSTREVRGVPSPGMLCAEDELGLSEDHGGILVLSEDDGLAVGSDFASGAGLPDTVLELNITPNRADCLGHVGVAREVAALFPEARLTLPAPDLTPYLAPRGEAFSVEILEPEGCPRYTARALYGVRVRKSPLWLRLRLLRLGVRAISNIVDATNLTMLEWGQPLHAFDLRRLRGRIVVRRGFEGEALLTLDGNARVLQADDLIIADSAEPGSGVAIAGVMGGRESEVSDQTTDLLLESAYFNPSWVRRTARRLRLHSEASHRFERGVDPTIGVAAASLRCAQLIVQLGGGQVTVDPVLHDACPRPIEPAAVPLRPARTRLLLGREMPAAEQAALLRALGLMVEEAGSGGEEALQVRVPTARGDLTREADLIEEIARLSGYEGIPARLPPLTLQAAEAQAGARRPEAVADRARDLCVSLGLTEIITFSFGSPERLRLLGCPEGDRRARPLLLHNPLREELSALRTQLLPGLLEALRVHLSRGQRDVRLFEVGEVFLRAGRGPEVGDLPDERTRVAGVLAGCRDHWLKEQKGDELDFFDVRGVVDELVIGLGLGLGLGLGRLTLRATQPGEVPWLHPGVSAVLVDGDGTVVGELGEVHPDLRGRMEIEARAFAFELDLPQGLAGETAYSYQALPRFPGTSRDLSFFVDAQVPAGDLITLLRHAGETLLTDVQVLEDYREAGRVPAGQKGMLLSLTYRSPERTLTDEEVQRAHDGVVGHLRKQVRIDLR